MNIENFSDEIGKSEKGCLPLGKPCKPWMLARQGSLAQLVQSSRLLTGRFRVRTPGDPPQGETSCDAGLLGISMKRKP